MGYSKGSAVTLHNGAGPFAVANHIDARRRAIEVHGLLTPGSHANGDDDTVGGQGDFLPALAMVGDLETAVTVALQTLWKLGSASHTSRNMAR